MLITSNPSIQYWITIIVFNYKHNAMKNLFIIILFPTLMFGQIKQVNNVSQKKQIQEAINFHNDIRIYQLNTLLEFNQSLSMSAKQWAENIIKTGEFEFDPKIPEIGENLYRGEISDSDFIANYNPYLDAATYWATNRKGDGVSFENMTLSDLSKIGMGVAYGNGKVVVVARYE